jgi:hypothetical protein
VKAEVLYNILLEAGTSKKLVRLTKMCLSETYNKARVGKLLANKFLIQNGLMQGEVALELSGIYKLLVYENDVN